MRTMRCRSFSRFRNSTAVTTPPTPPPSTRIVCEVMAILEHQHLVRFASPARQDLHRASRAAGHQLFGADAARVHARSADGDLRATSGDALQHRFDVVEAVGSFLTVLRARRSIADQKDAELFAVRLRE